MNLEMSKEDFSAVSGAGAVDVVGEIIVDIFKSEAAKLGEEALEAFGQWFWEQLKNPWIDLDETTKCLPTEAGLICIPNKDYYDDTGTAFQTELDDEYGLNNADGWGDFYADNSGAINDAIYDAAGGGQSSSG